MLIDDLIGLYAGYAVLAGWLATALILAGMAYRRRSRMLAMLSFLVLLSIVLAITILPVLVRFNRVLGYGSAALVALAWVLLWLKIDVVYAFVGSRFGIQFITSDRANLQFIQGLNGRLLQVVRQIYVTLGSDTATLEVKEVGKRGNAFLEIRLKPHNSQAPAVVVRLFNEVTLLIGPHRARVQLADYIDDEMFDAVELGREAIKAVVSGRYSERIQRLYAGPATAVGGSLPVRGRTLSATRGLFLPFLRTVVRRYEPYKATS